MTLDKATTSEELKYCLNSNFKFENAYHYTTLESLYKIYKNKTLRFSQLAIMNDKLECKFAKNCDEYFFCLTKADDSAENFGMWAMYGKITEYNSDNPSADKIGVKIQFPKAVIENLRNDYSLHFHAVGYGNIQKSLSLKNLNSKIISGSVKTKNDIALNGKILAGYIKDIAWKYENEFRLGISKDNEKVELNGYRCDIKLSNEILKELVVYPSPLSSKNECEKIFRNIKESEKLDVSPSFEENNYKDTYQFLIKNN